MLARGELTLDSTIADLAPPRPVFGNGLGERTLEALVTHTSGLPRQPLDPSGLLRALSRDPYAGTTPEAFWDSLAWLPRQLIAPTVTLTDSDPGYALLGQLLARRAGSDFEGVLRGRVLEPYGVPGVQARHGAAAGVPRARGMEANGRPAFSRHYDAYVACGGLSAGADDLLTWVSAHLAADQPAVVEALRVRRSFGGGRAVSLGWLHGDLAGRRLIWQAGNSGGQRSFVGFLPESGVGIVVLATGQGDVEALGRHLLDTNLPSPAPFQPDRLAQVLTVLLVLTPTLLAIIYLRRAWMTWRGGAAAWLDRLDLIPLPLQLAVLLVLAHRFGRWQQIDFGWWWASVVVCTSIYLALCAGTSALPVSRPGAWRAFVRGFGTVLVATVLVLLLR